MDLTPPSLTRSPTSPSHTRCPSESPSPDYPSPALLDQQYRILSPYTPRLSCSMAPPLGRDSPVHHSEVRSSTEWPASGMTASSASSIPNALSLEYDPFASYDSSVHHSYGGHDAYSPAHTAHMAGIGHPPPSPPVCATPLSNQRQPRLSLPLPQGNNAMSGALPSRAKAEEGHGEYGQADVAHFAAPRPAPSPYGGEAPAYPAPSPGFGAEQHGSLPGWPRTPAESEPLYSGAVNQSAPLDQDPRGRQQQRHQQHQQLRLSRSRKATRRLTTREEANFQCGVKGCGKLFSRSYNFKAHMETHDEKREYPFPCTVNGCDKKFVRKTDLQRHHQSVHAKERNHKCDYCGRMFARKDTLRRHMDDGCSRRFDVDPLALRSEAYGSSMAPARRSAGPPSGINTQLTTMVPPPPGTLPPLTIPMTTGESTVPGPHLVSMHRRHHEVSTGDAGQGYDWPR